MYDYFLSVHRYSISVNLLVASDNCSGRQVKTHQTPFFFLIIVSFSSNFIVCIDAGVDIGWKMERFCQVEIYDSM